MITVRRVTQYIVRNVRHARPFELLVIGAELEGVLGVKVDGVTPQSLREQLRDEVLSEAVPL